MVDPGVLTWRRIRLLRNRVLCWCAIKRAVVTRLVETRPVAQRSSRNHPQLVAHRPHLFNRFDLLFGDSTGHQPGAIGKGGRFVLAFVHDLVSDDVHRFQLVHLPRIIAFVAGPFREGGTDSCPTVRVAGPVCVSFETTQTSL